MSSNQSGFFTFRRMFSLVTLFASLIVLFLALKKPHTVVTAQSPEAVAANASSFQQKFDQLAQAQADGQTSSEIRLTGDEVAAAIAQANGPQPVASAVSTETPGNATPTDSTANATPAPNEAIEGATLHDPIVTFEGDVVRGQFATEIKGKTVYVTVAGHLGARDGYATFDPTEFKIGDLSVPVSLVNPALQKKMAEQRDRMKLPDFISDVRVENGELVVKQK
jgi:hypothetical protein